MTNNVIEVNGLNIWVSGDITPPRHIVKNVSFSLQRGQCLALVGESGSGKSVTARALVGLAGERLKVQAETLALQGESLLGRSDAWWQQVRGSKVGFILQDALVSLDPLRPVGQEIAEALALHGWGTPASRQQKVHALLEDVGVPQAALRASQRPGELSGGLRQRALIASAIAMHPEVIIADEPTTALDVTVQAQVLDVLRQMLDRGTSVILISHDLAVVAKIADHILVMQGGSIVESGAARQVLQQPQHAYTQGLINAIPSEHTKGQRLSSTAPIQISPSRVAEISSDEVLLEARHITKRFRGQSAVADVSFQLKRGETLGIVGESGSGKTTLSRIALALESPDSGEVLYRGNAWSHASAQHQRKVRRQIAVVYQDPLSSFDPRWRVSDILFDAIALDTHPVTQTPRERAISLLQSVGLTAEHLHQWPARMSGGQRQRVAIARAIATHPQIIVLDEAVSALDVTIQAQILDLLSDLQAQLGVSYLFISHDLGVIHHMSDRVLVMQNGIAVEQGNADDVFYRPSHPYTQQLLASLPRLGTAETA
ncbi:ABC transporter ATP-binding protein [Pantoea sp. Acro-805]|uniref:ABC transporter ATP-binding protein n=1 Tax=Candidatus Pantoea formicae TaxID=2608355 RepID=A0ABX0QYP3_9GAMM|nr:ABC transporter ATP-binding protein [Pantoea formicae]NIF00745.1 ABC transporter ATP-binding protein [Pantoea formicae]